MIEECGVFGAFVKGELESEVFHIAKEVLFHLQHRGQEAAGIVVGNGTKFKQSKGMGLVQNVFVNGNGDYRGKLAVGHVRYSTRGRSDLLHAQPLVVEYLGGEIAIAHNGQLDNADEIRERLEREGTIFVTHSDTEVILHVLTKRLKKPPFQWKAKEIAKVLSEEISGSYSLIMATPKKLMVFRDPKGYRPLSYIEDAGSYFFASEDSALKVVVGDKGLKEFEQGSYFEVSDDGVYNGKFANTDISAHCFFEFVYFARPDSNIFGHSVHLIREELGKQLARENPVDADIVIPVMDSGFSAALGYSKQSGIPLELGLVRNHWVGRTFIKPKQRERQKGVRNKLHPVKKVIENKRVVLVDDSLVRGTTMREIVNMVREAGAKEVHVAIASPPVKYPCHWGIDIPTSDELIASNRTLDEIKKEVNSDSIAYVSIDGVKEILKDEFEAFCMHCFDGRRK